MPLVEDSEGDLNVISEDEDLQDAHTYALQKAENLKCSILDRAMFHKIREEQEESTVLNKSHTWEQINIYRQQKQNKQKKSATLNNQSRI